MNRSIYGVAVALVLIVLGGDFISPNAGAFPGAGIPSDSPGGAPQEPSGPTPEIPLPDLPEP